MSDSSFLKYFIHEDLYDIKEADHPNSEGSKAAVSQIEKSVVEEPVAPIAPTPKLETPKIAAKDVAPQKIKLSDHEVLVVFDAATDKMVETQSIYLGKILSAVKLSMEQVDLCHVSKSSTIDKSGYRQVLSFTDKYTEFASSKYTIETKAGLKALLADDLSLISASVELRKQLWEALKSMFGV